MILNTRCQARHRSGRRLAVFGEAFRLRDEMRYFRHERHYSPAAYAGCRLPSRVSITARSRESVDQLFPHANDAESQAAAPILHLLIRPARVVDGLPP